MVCCVSGSSTVNCRYLDSRNILSPGVVVLLGHLMESTVRNRDIAISSIAIAVCVVVAANGKEIEKVGVCLLA